MGIQEESIYKLFLFTEATIAELGVTGDPGPIREITSLVHRTFRLTSERTMKHILHKYTCNHRMMIAIERVYSSSIDYLTEVHVFEFSLGPSCWWGLR